MQSAIPNPQSAIAGPDILSQFRVRTVAEVIDAAFRVYRRNFVAFLLIVVVALVPLQLLSYLTDVFVLGIYDTPDFSSITTTTTSSIAARNVASQLSTLKSYLETLVEYLAQWALTAAIVSVVFGKAISLGLAYRSLGRNLGRALGLIFLQALIALAVFSPMVCAVLLLFVGGGDFTVLILPLACLSPFTTVAYLIIDVRLKLALPAAVVEQLTPRQAIRRSLGLTRNYWWRTFALVTVLGILNTVVSVGPAGVITALLGLGLRDVFATLAITRLIGILTTAVFAPIEMGAIAFYYFDQRVRKEGFDLDTAIAERYETDYEQKDDGQWAADDRRYNPTSSYSPHGQYSQVQPVLGVGDTLSVQSETSQPTMPIFGIQPPVYQESPIPVPPVEAEPTPISRALAKDADLFPLLATGHNRQAMQTFRKRAQRRPPRDVEHNGNTEADPSSRVRRVSKLDSHTELEGEV
ncbi:MAG: hypothetical protein WCD37_06940 [Chloroflexia bacterium]